jgi:hypothetical protein
MYSLIGKWAILPGNEKKATAALKKLALEVQKNEPTVLLYMIYIPDFKEKSLPTPPAGEVVFFEIYKDKSEFEKHLTAPAFTNFVKKYGKLFLQDFATTPNIFMTTETLKQLGGFARQGITQ